MRIHTDKLTSTDLQQVLTETDVSLYVLGESGSRSHRRAFDIALRGSGKRHTKRPNTGVFGANSNEYAATYDDWGHFLAGLFTLDASAKAGPYKGVEDFHSTTKGKFSRKV
jgi:hypothetical protein